MDRAYSLLQTKSIDEETRTITGIASTPTADRVGDIVEPKGAQFQVPLPLLYQHQHDQPIGHVTSARVTPKGIEITAQFAKVDEPGQLKDRLDLAWQSVKAGLVRGLSIGFKALEYERIGEKNLGMRFTKWLWLELSAVTIPANGECSITSVKNIDRRHLPSAGLPVVSLNSAPANGANQSPKGAVKLNSQRGTTK